MDLESHKIRKIKKRELMETLKKAEQNNDLEGFVLASKDYLDQIIKDQTEYQTGWTD